MPYGREKQSTVSTLAWHCRSMSACSIWTRSPSVSMKLSWEISEIRNSTLLVCGLQVHGHAVLLVKIIYFFMKKRFFNCCESEIKKTRQQNYSPKLAVSRCVNGTVGWGTGIAASWLWSVMDLWKHICLITSSWQFVAYYPCVRQHSPSVSQWRDHEDRRWRRASSGVAW